jgi:hypothetical protein
MKNILFASIAAFIWIAALPLTAQVGKAFPKIEAENLDGDLFQLPGSFAKPYTLVGIGTSKKAEEDLRTWQIPVYNKFIAKTGFMDEMFDVEVCFLPLFTGASKAAKGSVVKKLRENNESIVADHLLIYSGSREPFEEIDADGKGEPVFVLIDHKGTILWKAEGAFKQTHIDKIEEIISR